MPVSNIFLTGIRSSQMDAENRSVAFSNVTYISLPLVYLVFILLDIQIYLNADNLAWDQLIVPIFILLCGLFILFNRWGWSLIGRVTFLFIWPVAFHIVPIVFQQTPSDYYLAFPVGLVFHSILIQTFLPRKLYPFLYWVFMLLSFSLILYAGDFLNRYDTDIEPELIPFMDSRYYMLDGIMYWLLFNLMTFYLLEVLDYRESQMRSRQARVQKQSKALSKSLANLRKTQRQLVNSEKMASIGMLSSGLAHEINNPLNFVKGGVHTLRGSMSEKDQKQVDHLLYSIEEGSRRIEEIVSSLMHFEASEEVRDAPCQVNAILEHCLVLLQPKIRDKIEIQSQYDAHLPEIPGNEARLHQAFLNILNNAVQAIDGQGEIAVSTVANEDHVLVQIKDSGVGMDPDDLDRIIDPFYTTRSPGEGKGLGLYITFNIIREHGGDIIYDSGKGKGTNCQVILPFYE